MLQEYGRLAWVGDSEDGVDITITGGHLVGFVSVTIFRTDVLELLGKVAVVRGD